MSDAIDILARDIEQRAQETDERIRAVLGLHAIRPPLEFWGIGLLTDPSRPTPPWPCNIDRYLDEKP